MGFDAGEAGRAGPSDSLSVFGAGDAAGDLRELFGAEDGHVLGHDVDVGVFGEILGDPFDDKFRFGDVVGHDEVTDHEAAAGDAIGADLEGADLAVHFEEGSLNRLGVIACTTEVFAGHVVIGVFEVGEVDINDAVEELEDVEVFPAAGIVDDGEAESFGGGFVEGEEDVRRVVGGCDDVDVVATLALECEHHIGEVVDGADAAVAAVTDVIVDAEDAAEAAVTEEDGAGAATADERRFFAEVRAEGGDDEISGGAAEAGVAFEAVDAAFTRANIAGTEALPEGVGTAAELATLMESEIGWCEGSHTFFGFCSVVRGAASGPESRGEEIGGSGGGNGFDELAACEHRARGGGYPLSFMLAQK